MKSLVASLLPKILGTFVEWQAARTAPAGTEVRIEGVVRQARVDKRRVRVDLVVVILD